VEDRRPRLVASNTETLGASEATTTSEAARAWTDSTCTSSYYSRNTRDTWGMEVVGNRKLQVVLQEELPSYQE
jgi:hypothetical protein